MIVKFKSQNKLLEHFIPGKTFFRLKVNHRGESHLSHAMFNQGEVDCRGIDKDNLVHVGKYFIPIEAFDAASIELIRNSLGLWDKKLVNGVEIYFNKHTKEISIEGGVVPLVEVLKIFEE